MTLTDIANIALEDIGAKAIGNIDGDDVLARKIKRRIFNSIESVSKIRNWTHLRQAIKLERTAEKTDDGWYQFNIPKGLLNVIWSSGRWVFNDGYILSPDERLKIICTIASFEPDKWGINLQNAVIAQLKKDMALSITNNPQIATTVFQMADIAIRNSMLHDAFDEKNKTVDECATWFKET